MSAILEPVGLAWLAGFIDGEGSLGLNRELDRRRNIVYLRPSLQITNTNMDALVLIRSMLPAGHIMRVRQERPQHREQYRYHMRNSAAMLELLRQLTPYLVVKRRQAELLLVFLYGRVGQRTKKAFPYTEADFRIWRELREVNRRGPR